jgi:hypothetical protein
MFAFGKAINKYRSVLRPKNDAHAIPAGSPLPLPGDPLLDKPAAEVGVDNPRSACSIASRLSVIPRVGQTGKPFRFENSHGLS